MMATLMVLCLCIFLDVQSPYNSLSLWLHEITLKRNNCQGNLSQNKRKQATFGESTTAELYHTNCLAHH
jgi:hypothetical protein